MAAEVLAASALTWFGAIAAFLSAVGVFGLAAHAVQSRRHEWAIRLAVGGAPGRVQWLVFGSGTLPMAAGLLIGLVMAGVAVVLLRGYWFDMGPLDAPVLLVPVGVMAGAGILASYLAALRVKSIASGRLLDLL